jgi:7,8-dihydroneopterin aldolase/epimerase/oxygenase
VTEDRLELRGLRVLGRCGVPPEERRRPQPLEVDLDVHLDLAPAGRSDDLDDTVDYGGVCSAAERAVTVAPAALLEHLAERVAEAVLAADDRVQEVAVAVRKLRPPVASQLATAGVHVRRRR